MANGQINQLLEFANMQMAAEAFLARADDNVPNRPPEEQIVIRNRNPIRRRQHPRQQIHAGSGRAIHHAIRGPRPIPQRSAKGRRHGFFRDAV